MSTKNQAPIDDPINTPDAYEEVFAHIAADDEEALTENIAPEHTPEDAADMAEAEIAFASELAVAIDTENTTTDEVTDTHVLDERDEILLAAAEAEALAAQIEAEDQTQSDDIDVTASLAELKPAIEAVLFVADEPLPFNQLCKILGDVNPKDVQATLNELAAAYDERESGLELREIAGGWRISTRPQQHEFIRKYLKSKPSARLSIPALETLAVIAYRQPVTVPEVLEIRGVSSSSAIKTLLEKRLIVTKGRKETVGRPMMYGTSKDFLVQFGLKDLSELPSIEDFEELAG